MAFKVVVERAIEWIEGSKIICKKLSKAETEAIDIRVADRKDIDTDKLGTARLFEKIYDSVRGWEGIENENGEPLPCNETTKYEIFKMLLDDSAFMEKFSAFMWGPLGNLKAGLTSPLNGNGAPASAVNVSVTTEDRGNASN